MSNPSTSECGENDPALEDLRRSWKLLTVCQRRSKTAHFWRSKIAHFGLPVWLVDRCFGSRSATLWWSFGWLLSAGHFVVTDAVTVPSDVDQMAVVQESVDERCCHDFIA